MGFIYITMKNAHVIPRRIRKTSVRNNFIRCLEKILLVMRRSFFDLFGRVFGRNS